MSSDQPTAFPRGKRKSTSSSTTSSSVPSKKGEQPSSKKRATSSPKTVNTDDFLFGTNPALENALQSRSKHAKHTDDDDDESHPYDASSLAITSTLPLGGGAVLPPASTSAGKRIPPKIEALTFGKFAKGTKVLGVIREVCEEYAVVSLPTMLTGFVQRGENGAPLTKVLPPVNSIMAFYVLSTTTEAVSKRDQKQSGTSASMTSKSKRRIELSASPIHVNTGVRLEEYISPNSSVGSGVEVSMVVRGSIVSVEDHGCLVDLGSVLTIVGGVKRRAFCKFDAVEGGHEIDDDTDSEESDDDDDEDASDPTDTSGYKRKLSPGRIYDFAILPSNIIPFDGSSSTTAATILQLSLPLPSTLAKLVTSSTMMPNLSSLQPGMLISNVNVEAHAKNGMCVTFNKGVYRGSLDEDHLGGHRGVDGSGKKMMEVDGRGDRSMWWKTVFKGKHAKFTARIMAIDTATKIVRFSLNPHILAMNSDYEVSAKSFPHAVGSIIKNAQVIRVDPGIGALLALPSAFENEDDDNKEEIVKLDKVLSNNLLNNGEYRAASKVRTAYVHISKSMDNAPDKNDKSSKKGKKTNNNRTPEALFARHFSINTNIKSLRILSTSNLIDNIASCATAKSIVDAHVLTHADLSPGTLYKDVPVLQLLESGGVLVDLGVGTKGIIPSMHLFDKASHGSLVDGTEGVDGVVSGYRAKIRQAKYKIGNLVNVRCLTVNPAARQCVLTAKKTLVADDTDTPMADYTSIQPGMVAAGFISKLDAHGLTVTFYNNVHGRVSSRSLASELGVEDVKLNYSVGDVVAARVVECARRRNRNRTVTNDDEDDEEDMYYYQLKLSLKTVVENKVVVPASEDKSNEDTSATVPLAAGSLLMPKRMKVLQLVNCLNRDDGVFLPGYAVVAIKSKFFTSVPPGGSSDAVDCKLPYDQLLDSYNGSNDELDAIAQKQLTVGKRIDAEGLILSVPNGYDALPIITLRPSLIETLKKMAALSSSSSSENNDDLSIICPSPKSNLFTSLYVRGYVTRIDKRFGAFVRFLDGLTGLIPKLKKGLEEKLYDTILCKITALDVTSGPRPKILLKKVGEGEVEKKKRNQGDHRSKGAGGHGGSKGVPMRVGDVVGDVKVADINFARAKVYVLDTNDSSKVRARIHVTMANALSASSKAKLSKKEKQFKEEHKIGKCHPFYSWKVGDIIPDVRCVAVDNRDGVLYVELANGATSESSLLPSVVSDPSHLPPGSMLSAIVTSVSTTPSTHHGLWVQVCPGISGFIPALEVSDDAQVLNDLVSNYKIGARITCSVMDANNSNKKLHNRHQHRLQRDDDHDDAANEHQALELSVLMADSGTNDKKKQTSFQLTKPHRGNLVVGRIHRKSRVLGAPSLMLNLRGGFVGRCCITELEDVDGWENMPLGKAAHPEGSSKVNSDDQQQRVVSDSDADRSQDNDDDASDDEHEARDAQNNDYPDGKYVKCRVLGPARSKGSVELSLRDSRLEGDNLEDDAVPKQNEMAHAYVVSTTKMGCFVRLSRTVEGRIILKELSDEFIPNPSAVFPPGRLVVGKVKNIKESNNNVKKKKIHLSTMVDMDMRESVLLASGNRLTIDDIRKNSKYTGVITRVESYGVFVRIDNSDVSGLAHVSECSDTYIKDIHDLYNPGDLVKIIVVDMDKEQRRLGFSLKASNFVDDDSDDESTSSSGSESSDSMEEGSDEDEEMDSEDEDFVSKMKKKMEAGVEDMDIDEESNDDSGSESESDSSDDEDDESEGKLEDDKSGSMGAMDTNVGFDWGVTTSSKPTKSSKLASGDESSSSESDDSSEDESDDDDADSGFKSSHKARKKAAAKRREEEETSRRETALADGTADDTPETSADFERLVASSPNSSEIWIKYMAFHLSLADIDSARNIANRAFERIEFRQEGEKLNVWTALLTLELKYGTDKSLHQAVDRACQQNNPKQVYLRVCELLEKEVDASASGSGSADVYTSTKRADEMFKKMCKKFKSKKSVWLAHFQYLLKGTRHEEAHALLKRSLQSLPTYKHVEVMSKFAQMEFELGSAERGRTIFNALLEKHPKRMDLLFVNIDKEAKNGNIAKARALFDCVVNPVSQDRKFKFSDKQMKSLFKKWFRMEEEHGDDESQERVREEARKFVGKTTQ